MDSVYDPGYPFTEGSRINEKQILEGIRNRLTNEVRVKVQDAKAGEGFIPEEVLKKTREQIAKMYTVIGKVEDLLTHF